MKDINNVNTRGSGGGSSRVSAGVRDGLSMKEGIGGPRELGMGTKGPAQLPMGPAKSKAKGSMKFC